MTNFSAATCENCKPKLRDAYRRIQGLIEVIEELRDADDKVSTAKSIRDMRLNRASRIGAELKQWLEASGAPDGEMT